MRFRVSRSERDDSMVPDRLSDVPALSRDDAQTTRHFDSRLNRDDMWTINDQAFDPSDSLADPALGSVELWRLTSDFHHPVHLHMAHFQGRYMLHCHNLEHEDMAMMANFTVT